MVEDEVSEDSDQSPLGDEPIIALPPAVRKSLHVEANSLCPRFYHRPKKPFCEACRRAKMKEKRKYAGSYRKTRTQWRQLATGDHIVSKQDHIFGLDGHKDILVIKDAFVATKQLTLCRTKRLNAPWCYQECEGRAY